MRKTPRWIALAAMAIAAGCAGARAQRPGAATPEPAVVGVQSGASETTASRSSASRGQDATGLWEGTSTASCQPLQPSPWRCNAVVKITLRILQRGTTLGGDYACATGTMVCRDTNTSGYIAHGEVHDGGGVALRVMMPDGSSCLFNGRWVRDAMTGTYFCMQGGGYIEQGRFALQRSY